MSDTTINKTRDWITQVFLVVLVIYFYVFMEWLFFVTKPSFMSILGFTDTLRVLLVTPVPLVPAGVVLLFLFWIPTRGVRGRISQTVCLVIGKLIPAFILAFSLFLLVDNFSYTVFRFGVRSAEGVQRFVYVLLLLILVVFSYRLLHNFARKLARSAAPYRRLFLVAPGIFIISVMVAVVTHNSSGIVTMGNQDGTPLKNRPNILLISSDGLNAENMSVYGYHRETTPYTGKLAHNALLCENCFTNAGTSGASIASMLTGKMPTRTRLIYPPEILKGEDAYQHLPGILRNHGYTNFDVSIRQHADPYDLNMRNSFDWANFREIKGNHLFERLSSFLGQEPSYFLQKMTDRVTDRILHVSGVRKMEDPLAEVVKIKKRYYKDDYRIRIILSLIKYSPSPFFAHLHLLGTHGPEFTPPKRLYSKGQSQDRYWMTDFYDDSILNFDNQVREILQGMRMRKVLHKTLVVIFSDHGQNFTVNTRLPLIFLFPNGEHSGRIEANVQNLDIAPTILDYLGIKKPDWMEGLSLISSEAERDRFIFTVDPKHSITENKSDEQQVDRSKPPFYSLKTIGVFFHDKFFELDVDKSTLTIADIKGYAPPGGGDDIPDPERVGQMIIGHLAGSGYDTSSIKTPLAVRIPQ